MTLPNFLQGFSVGENTVSKNAITVFNKLGMPTAKNENWHYTDLNKILKSETYNNQSNDTTGTELIDDCITITINNGDYSNAQNQPDLPAGLTISVNNDIGDNRFTNNQDKHAMVALNTAVINAELNIDIAQNLDKPVHLAYVNNGNSLATFPKVFINIGAGIKARFIETYESKDAGKILVNAVNEIKLDKDSELLHYKLQNDNADSNHIAFNHISLQHSAHYAQSFICVNTTTTRNETQVELLDEYAKCEIQGAYIATNTQKIDNTILVNHMAENCESRQLFNGVVDNKAQAIFQGKVFVDKIAQKTDGYQMHRAMLLSNDAEVSCKPELEIYADDVKCSHGASTKQIDAEQLFYLKSRGIDEQTAKHLLIKAFLSEVLDNIDTPNIHEYLQNLTLDKASAVLTK